MSPLPRPHPAQAESAAAPRDDVAVFRDLVARGRLDQPGSGRTAARLEALSAGSGCSLSAGRLFEAHADGQSILLDAHWGEPEALGLLGVWASERRSEPVRIARSRTGWVARGMKGFCSGAPIVDHALVTAFDGDDQRLALIAVHDHRVDIKPSTWVGHGMRATLTRAVELHDVPVVELVGGPGWYLDRPGFWHGAVGVAASWFGGALAVLETMRTGVDDDPHHVAALGAAAAEVFAMKAALDRSAREIDEDPDDGAAAQRRALAVRAVVATGCLAVLERAAAALGPRAMAFDADHAQRIVDLDVYVRQDHGCRDRELLGRLIRDRAVTSC